ncbi:uncharacterized protein LOC106866737 isoform X2 [Brachypodium distachyon]|uniref:Transmembrane protein n=1 Tax=Brachypodium distachyon TaxID=15368 RepID=A0A2K2CTL0_BRADI|nr:uncharacterized protein LOC106866737 isoform X2 [Brachypodium distachyon]PNT65357.1 hypothetical protein BRADI_4g41216v3 [Brachypodium distachyon]|eukprot:XP_024310582.1 uncharacterized protein LOC106866737 isoform X2 [Brachypodium distachyon]
MTTTAGITVDDCDGSKPKPHVGVLEEQRRGKAELPSSSPAPTQMDGIPAVATTAAGSDSDTGGTAGTASPAMSITRVEPFFGKQESVDEVLNNAKHLSVQSQEILKHLERLCSQACKVLEIKNEDRIKSDLAEERKQQLIEDVASHLKDLVAKTSLKADDLKRISFQAKKDDAMLLKCQTVLTDFVFFMLLVPWLVHTHDEKSHPVGFYIRLFAVSVLAFLGMVGYLMSHIVRGAKWRQAVYCITIVSVLSTMGLVAFALFSLIPLDYGHYTAVSWIYPGAFVLVGIILLVSWCSNYCEIPREDSELNIPLV